MRIVGGKYKGRTLVPFKGEKIRPTGDMVRESLFNILRDKIVDSRFLDLFCGTGAIGIEALSRGAAEVVFNDADRESLAVLNKNLSKLGVTEKHAVLNRDAIMLLQNAGEKFDFIYADPPYKSGLYEKVVAAAGNALKDGGTLILEGETPYKETTDTLTIADERRYGRAYLTFFKKV